MDVIDAVLRIEGGDAEEADTLEAWQLLVDTGTVWGLQGFYGRTALDLLTRGLILPAPPRAYLAVSFDGPEGLEVPRG